MSAESARDALADLIAHTLETADGEDDSYGYEHPAAAVIDTLRENAPVVLALLAEPQVCGTCGNTRRVPFDPSDAPGWALNDGAAACSYRVCPDCPVAVDVLDLLVQAGAPDATKTIAGVLSVHLRDPDTGDCSCGFTRTNIVDPGTWRWHVAELVTEALGSRP